ncbi:MAG TPA: PCP reductase family protein [Candidatus Polarisedimenticolaceae bacterium]|nr:PCP reductase family protein [Candidatus Polarisedimenticolaceae bacterium]
MKFLCVPCDQPMKMMAVTPPDRGSVAVTYGCPECGYEMAMLTNPFETQLVTSLGVKIGPNEGKDAATATSGSKCPFAGMMAGASEEAEETKGPKWTAEAEARMESVPSFVRSMAKTGIEKFAEESGYTVIDERVLDEARSRFGM